MGAGPPRAVACRDTVQGGFFVLVDILKRWESLRDSDHPLPEAVKIGEAGHRVVYVSDGWGPPVPYPAAVRGDGSMNHGYVRLKGNSDAIASVPEVVDWPDYQEFLSAINAPSSPLESVGCEKHFFPVDAGEAKVRLGSYTDVIFSDLELNDDAENHLRLATLLAAALDGSERWWSGAELELQRLKGLAGCKRPWGLMVRVLGNGRDEDQARESWRASVQLLCRAISELDARFPRNTK